MCFRHKGSGQPVRLAAAAVVATIHKKDRGWMDGPPERAATAGRTRTKALMSVFKMCHLPHSLDTLVAREAYPGK